MPRREPAPDARVLADRLRAEAARSRPAFSEALHARICRAVQQYRAEEGGTTRAAAGRHCGVRWAVAAVAAAASLGAAILVWQAAPSGCGPDIPPSSRLADQSAPDGGRLADAFDFQVDAHTVAGLAASVPSQIDALVDSAVAAQQWAYLDHDAQLALRMLADRLPFDLASSLTTAEPPANP